MDRSQYLWILFALILPGVMVVVPAAAGVWLFLRGSARRHASMRAIGAGLVCTGIAVLAVAAIVALSGLNSSWRGWLPLVLTLAACLTAVIAGIASLAMALVSVYLMRSRLRAAGYVGITHWSVAAVSSTALLVAAAFGIVEYVVPRLQIWPYTSLSASGTQGTTVLHGWSRWTGQSDPIIWVDYRSAQRHTAQFDLASLDALGTLDVYVSSAADVGPQSRAISLPFEPSAYELSEAGELRRLDTATGGLVGRWSRQAFVDQYGSSSQPRGSLEIEFGAESTFRCENVAVERASDTGSDDTIRAKTTAYRRSGRIDASGLLARFEFDASDADSGFCGLRAIGARRQQGVFIARLYVAGDTLSLANLNGDAELRFARAVD